AVASVTVNPVDTAGQILHYPLQDCAGSSAEDSFCYDMTHHLNNDSGSSQPLLTDHYTRLGLGLGLGGSCNFGDWHWIPSVVSWQESLESEEYGFTWLEPSQDLYIRLNGGVNVGAIYNLTMHCKYFAARATLPPVPEGNLEDGGAQLQLGLCMYGNDVHSAAATIEGNAFTPVASSDINGHEDGGILLQAPTQLGAGAVASVTVNPVDTAGQILHYPLQDCAGSSAEDSFCYDMTHHLNNDSGSSQPFLTDHYTRLGVDFDSCSVLCERLADYVSNVDNPYRGVDVDQTCNRTVALSRTNLVDRPLAQQMEGAPALRLRAQLDGASQHSSPLCWPGRVSIVAKYAPEGDPSGHEEGEARRLKTNPLRK
ncbi:hypothetical protein THAOC_28810, partial [Thalassiosira oceanica]